MFISNLIFQIRVLNSNIIHLVGTLKTAENHKTFDRLSKITKYIMMILFDHMILGRERLVRLQDLHINFELIEIFDN